MPHLDREDGNISYPERVFFDPVETEIGYTGILYIGESIRKFPYDRFLRHFIGIEVHRPVLEEIIGPDIIQTGNMILMRMGKNNGIQLPDIIAKHLVPEIWCGVHDQRSGG
jgi:hypothetical protein